MTNTETTAVTARTSAGGPPHKRPGGKLSVRAVIGITLLVVWSVATATGILLYVAPEGQRAGQRELLFGLSKTTWGDVHWWISLAAVLVTVVHLAVDWRTFRSCVHHLARAH